MSPLRRLFHMTSQNHDSDGPQRSGSVRMSTLARAAEFLVLAGLLIVDFELGAHLVTERGGDPVVAGLSTALVAIVVAVLALARRILPFRVTMATALGVSLLASVVSAVIGVPLLSLTEAAALIAITVLGLRESSSRGAVFVGAAALFVAVAGVVLRLGFDVTVVLVALLVWGCAIAAGIAGRYVTMRRESALEAARREERMELARELHDVVAHQVTGIVVQAQAALVVARTNPDRVAEAFSAIESTGTEALAGMRRMVGAIRDETTPDAPLTVPYELSDIPALVDRFDSGRQRTVLHFEEVDSPIPPVIGESSYRIVREALTNVRRHAPEGFTRVSVRVIDSELVIEVGNDGVRARSMHPGSRGFGLTGMAERVNTLGGRMHAGPDESDSWKVWVSLPLGVAK